MFQAADIFLQVGKQRRLAGRGYLVLARTVWWVWEKGSLGTKPWEGEGERRKYKESRKSESTLAPDKRHAPCIVIEGAPKQYERNVITRMA